MTIELEPIELHLRSDSLPDDAVLLLRGGPVTVEKLAERAARQVREFGWNQKAMASVSVDGTVAGWTAELLLRERMWSRSQFATATVVQVRAAGFVVLPTHAAPHFDIVLGDASLAEAARLVAIFGTPEDNPFKHRRRRPT